MIGQAMESYKKTLEVMSRMRLFEILKMYSFTEDAVEDLMLSLSAKDDSPLPATATTIESHVLLQRQCLFY